MCAFSCLHPVQSLLLNYLCKFCVVVLIISETIICRIIGWLASDMLDRI